MVHIPGRPPAFAYLGSQSSKSLFLVSCLKEKFWISRTVRAALPLRNVYKTRICAKLNQLRTRPMSPCAPGTWLTHRMTSKKHITTTYLPPSQHPAPLPRLTHPNPTSHLLHPHDYPATLQATFCFVPKSSMPYFLYIFSRHDSPDTVGSLLTCFHLAHTADTLVSIAVLGQHFSFISLLTSTDIVYPVMAFCFVFFLCFEFQPFGDSLNAWSHRSAGPALNSFLLAASWGDCTCDSHLASLIAAQLPPGPTPMPCAKHLCAHWFKISGYIKLSWSLLDEFTKCKTYFAFCKAMSSI